MRLAAALPLIAGLALAACQADDKPKTEDQVRGEAAKLAKPVPGQYRSTSKLISFEVPGMSTEQSERIKQMFASNMQGRTYCLTEAEADKGFEEAMKKLPQGKCSYDRFSVSGNYLEAQLSCETGKDMKGVIGLKGTVSETGSQITMSVEQGAPGMEGNKLKVVAEVASERTGDCAGG